MKNVLYKCIGALLAALVFSSCNDEIDIRQDYDFSLSSWYLQKQIATGETVEIRFYLDREGDYEKAEYEIGYIQMEGKGEVSDSEFCLYYGILRIATFNLAPYMAGIYTGAV